ncbi:ABC-three component system protein [Burkholderia sp. SCN-KJ]|uniref:ABC-three component system protein n=1 Tax=Burkholderia sp. SCN-KJ TaxID=2969248 RepID=UPI00214FAB1B|nr:ABC-three component system protein [Burkholderia sp. SCN-KJ]MCR4469740.1 hypothetical protein [Burkholderia sp. SCN-KJ]
MSANQKNNTAGRDIAGRDIIDNSTTSIVNVTTSVAASLELAQLYAKLKADGIGDPSGGAFSAKLEHYMSAVTEGDVRGLAEKLRESGRDDLLLLAMDLKQRAAKSIMKHQTSRTAQRIFTIILTELHSKFTLLVTPVIQQGSDRVAVDQCINAIVQTIQNMLGENVLEIDAMDLQGLLYFLAGNCHIRWDKC